MRFREWRDYVSCEDGRLSVAPSLSFSLYSIVGGAVFYSGDSAMRDDSHIQDFHVWMDFTVTARKVFHDFGSSILQFAVVVADHFRIAGSPSSTMPNPPDGANPHWTFLFSSHKSFGVRESPVAGGSSGTFYCVSGFGHPQRIHVFLSLMLFMTHNRPSRSSSFVLIQHHLCPMILHSSDGAVEQAGWSEPGVRSSVWFWDLFIVIYFSPVAHPALGIVSVLCMSESIV